MRKNSVLKRRSTVDHGFTLVEILVVISIIVLLTAIAVPAVMRSVSSAREFAVKTEVDAIADAIEKYRSKYGDYPPDGSSWTVIERHLQKVFPQIQESELLLIFPFDLDSSPPNAPYSGTPTRNDSDPAIATESLLILDAAGNDIPVRRSMDPAEALVFFLGGFSSDPRYPFSGDGGPFVKVSETPLIYQYNTQRKNSLFDFDASRVTTRVNSGLTESSDEATFASSPVDLLPVYLDKYSKRPIAYFDSRSYRIGNGSNGEQYVNRYANVLTGTAVPYISDEINTRVTPNTNYFVNKTTFQIISVGLDQKFNQVLPTSTNWPTYVSERDGFVGIYPSTILDVIKHSPDFATGGFDNATNFSTRPKVGSDAQDKQNDNP